LTGGAFGLPLFFIGASLATPKNPNDFWKVAQPDFIPEGEEYLHPHRGGIFCDFIPEKETCEDVRPTAEYEAAALIPGETLETILIEEATEELETFLAAPALKGKKNA
jgi:hypothetical protein